MSKWSQVLPYVGQNLRSNAVAQRLSLLKASMPKMSLQHYGQRRMPLQSIAYPTRQLSSTVLPKRSSYFDQFKNFFSSPKKEIEDPITVFISVRRSVHDANKYNKNNRIIIPENIQHIIRQLKNDPTMRAALEDMLDESIVENYEKLKDYESPEQVAFNKRYNRIETAAHEMAETKKDIQELVAIRKMIQNMGDMHP